MASELDAADLPPGTQLGSYVLAGKLGQGGMGTVYLAEQTTIGRKVALKILNPSRLRQEDAIQRFVQEAKTAAALQHHNLVTIHDVGQIPKFGLVFYSMDYIHGRTLYTIVHQEGPMPADRARPIIQQLASALGFAHRNNLVHRDVKPENVLIDEFGIPKLTDLGLAFDRVGNGKMPRNARQLSIVGTPGWSPPEQLRNPARCTSASDVFSLGGLFYYLLTGSAPFGGESLIDLAINIATLDPPLLGNLEARDEQLIRMMMAKQPDERPPHGDAVAELLEHPEHIGSSGYAAHDASSSRVAQRRRTRRRRR